MMSKQPSYLPSVYDCTKMRHMYFLLLSSLFVENILIKKDIHHDMWFSNLMNKTFEYYLEKKG